MITETFSPTWSVIALYQTFTVSTPIPHHEKALKWQPLAPVCHFFFLREDIMSKLLYNNTGFSTDTFNGFSDHITRINNFAYNNSSKYYNFMILIEFIFKYHLTPWFPSRKALNFTAPDRIITENFSHPSWSHRVYILHAEILIPRAWI